MSDEKKLREKIEKSKRGSGVPGYKLNRRLAKGNPDEDYAIETRSPGHILGQQQMDHSAAREHPFETR